MSKRVKDDGMNGLLLQAQAAKLLGISRAGVGYLIAKKKLRFVSKFGRKMVYKSDVENYKSERKAAKKGKRK